VARGIEPADCVGIRVDSHCDCARLLGGWVAFGGAALALLLAAYELNSMYAHRGWHPSTVLSTALGAVFLIAARILVLEHDASRVLVVLGVSISALVVLAFAWIMTTRKVLDGVMIDWALTIASGFYLGWPLAFFLLLRGDTFGAGTKGFWWLLALFSWHGRMTRLRWLAGITSAGINSLRTSALRRHGKDSWAGSFYGHRRLRVYHGDSHCVSTSPWCRSD